MSWFILKLSEKTELFAFRMLGGWSERKNLVIC